MWVRTLEHAGARLAVVLHHGSGQYFRLGYGFLSGMSLTTVRPLIRVWFGQGRWERHADLYVPLISNRRCPRQGRLPNDHVCFPIGSEFFAARAVADLRPIGIVGSGVIGAAL